MSEKNWLRRVLDFFLDRRESLDALRYLGELVLAGQDSPGLYFIPSQHGDDVLPSMLGGPPEKYPQRPVGVFNVVRHTMSGDVGGDLTDDLVFRGVLEVSLFLGFLQALQAHGEEAILQTNGDSNVFSYREHLNGYSEVHSLRVYWDRNRGDWREQRIPASSIDLYPGDRLFLRGRDVYEDVAAE